MSTVMLAPQTNKAGLWYQSQAAEDTKLVLTGRGQVHRIMVSNGNAAARFLWVFDNTSAAGTVLLASVLIPITSSISVDLPFGLPFSTGLFVAMSTTQKTYTATGGTDGLFTVGYTKRVVDGT